jgi:lysylphosphatidylglycerol synthetase-like protein (DUF2156 family)
MTTTMNTELAAVYEMVANHCDNPSGFLALNSGNSYFSAPDVPGFIAYRRSGRYLVQFAGPLAPPESAGELLTRFVEFAQREGARIISVQVQRGETDLYRRHGFTVNQVGASYSVDLARFSVEGTRFMRLRNKIARAYRGGLDVVEAHDDQWTAGLADVDGRWLASKGEHARQLEFLVGERGGPAQSRRRAFVGLRDGRPIGYISYSPAYGSRPGWLHDLSRRLPDELPGILEAINFTAINTFRNEGADWLHFGFTPFTGLNDDLEVPGHSPGFGWFMNWLGTYGDMVYPARTQLAYKQKWAPHVVLPEYVATQGRAQLGAFIHVFKASNAM